MPSIVICALYSSPYLYTPIKPVVALGFPCFFGAVEEEEKEEEEEEETEEEEEDEEDEEEVNSSPSCCSDDDLPDGSFLC